MSGLDFALIGAAGFIAERHYQAIKAIGGTIVAICDTSDCVGTIGRYEPEAIYFREPERFFANLCWWTSVSRPIDYLVICTPNYLHYSHVLLGLQAGMSIICEKPIALTDSELVHIDDFARIKNLKVYGIAQLRLSSGMIHLKIRLDREEKDKSHQVELVYATPRGHWFHDTWKADLKKAGGLLTNIGIHGLDLLTWLFGGPVSFGAVHETAQEAWGEFHLERADVGYHLSCHHQAKPVRLLKVDGEEYELSGKFEDLHLESYRRIQREDGFTIADLRPGIALAEELRKKTSYEF